MSDVGIMPGLGQVLAVIAAVMGCFYVGYAILCYKLSRCVKRIPAQYRKIEPGQVCLLMIPVLYLAWNFVAFPNISASFKSYFDSIGDKSVGDCGAGIGTAYALCTAAPVAVGLTAGARIDALNWVAAGLYLGSFMLLIVYFVTVISLKNRIPKDAA